MSQLSERMASAGWPMLDEMDGEPVSYGRVVNGSAASGFPKSIDVLFCVDDRARNVYEDGRGDKHVATAQLKLSDIGTTIQIENDFILRADTTKWTVKAVLSIVGGLVVLRVERFAKTTDSSGKARVER
jgi:hypothetical protein